MEKKLALSLCMSAIMAMHAILSMEPPPPPEQRKIPTLYQLALKKTAHNILDNLYENKEEIYASIPEECEIPLRATVFLEKVLREHLEKQDVIFYLLNTFTAYNEAFYELLDYYLHQGISLDTPFSDKIHNFRKFTPLCYAVALHSYDATKILLLLGANPDIQLPRTLPEFDDTFSTPAKPRRIIPSMTALHIATYSNNVCIAQLLLDYQAHLTIRDNAGQEPLDYARAQDHLAMRLTLRNALEKRKKALGESDELDDPALAQTD